MRPLGEWEMGLFGHSAEALPTVSASQPSNQDGTVEEEGEPPFPPRTAPEAAQGERG